jgi:predicted DNA-binding protein with PD1-like motif
MMTRLIHHAADGQRTFAAVLDTGDEVMTCLAELARQEGIDGASITGIGAFSMAVLAYFDWEKKAYLECSFEEQLEVASLIGDVAADDRGAPALHIHLVLGRRDYSALAGHLISGLVRPTLELIVTESPAHLRRRKDPETGLALIRL